MFRVIFEPDRGQRVPVRVWARAISPETVRQLQRLASRPWVVDFVAAMADAHLSEGVAVGTVFATERTVVPRALGGDLGCGMSALRVGSRPPDRRTLEKIVAALGRAIPTGDMVHRGRGIDVPAALFEGSLSTHTLEHTREALAGRHLGTLGGGNHFIELDRDAEGGLWLLVHSGSRGLGGAIAAHHQRAASGDGDLAGLDVETEAGAAYLNDAGWALEFARCNREALASRALEVLGSFIELNVERRIDIHHNFVAREHWFGRDVLVHRKGAVAVGEGTLALIPGSMGTASYIVEGMGNEDAFGSCSHGAGRVMSRKEARMSIRHDAFERAMHRVVYPDGSARHLVEEAPAAYRDIGEVLEDQEGSRSTEASPRAHRRAEGIARRATERRPSRQRAGAPARTSDRRFVAATWARKRRSASASRTRREGVRIVPRTRRAEEPVVSSPRVPAAGAFASESWEGGLPAADVDGKSAC